MISKYICPFCFVNTWRFTAGYINSYYSHVWFIFFLILRILGNLVISLSNFKMIYIFIKTKNSTISPLHLGVRSTALLAYNGGETHLPRCARLALAFSFAPIGTSWLRRVRVRQPTRTFAPCVPCSGTRRPAQQTLARQCYFSFARRPANELLQKRVIEITS